jgi:hypothetical protein
MNIIDSAYDVPRITVLRLHGAQKMLAGLSFELTLQTSFSL